MLLNRLVSIAAVFSLVGSALAAPLPRPLEANAPGGLELELEHEDGKHEIEAETHKIVLTEVEIEATDPNPSPKLGFVRRTDSERSMAGSVLAAQKQLDILKPQLEQAMLAPLGSIEKKVGSGLTSVDAVVNTLSTDMKSFIGADDATIYRNPSGADQLTDTEMAKIISNCLVDILSIDETVKHVSGYKVTSAQQKIRKNLSAMKATLGTVAPLVQANVASLMAMALSF